MASNFANTVSNYLLQQFKADATDEDLCIHKTYDRSEPDIDKSLTDPEIINQILGECNHEL